jgi:hypothetical protein
MAMAVDRRDVAQADGDGESKSSLSRIQRLMLIESSTRQGKANGSISGRRALSFHIYLFTVWH